MKATFAKTVVMLGFMIGMMGISACGSGSGGTTYGNTVTLGQPVVSTQRTVASVAVPPAVQADAAPVTVTITSTPYPGVITPSPVTIKSSKITYLKTSNSPAAAPATLPDQIGATGQILSGGSLALTMNVATSSFIKNVLVGQNNFVPGGGQVWEYFVTYYFTAVEDFTNNNLSFSVAGGTVSFQ